MNKYYVSRVSHKYVYDIFQVCDCRKFLYTFFGCVTNLCSLGEFPLLFIFMPRNSPYCENLRRIDHSPRIGYSPWSIRYKVYIVLLSQLSLDYHVLCRPMDAVLKSLTLFFFFHSTGIYLFTYVYITSQCY